MATSFSTTSKLISEARPKCALYCQIHGDFWQIPGDHIRARRSTKPSCPACYFENKRLTVSDVIQKSKKIHGSAYRYDKLVLGRNLREETTFYCVKCSAYFTQKPISHLQGRGCSRCCEPRIVCQKHGEFWQVPGDHTRIRGKGGFHCPACYLENKRLSVEEVVKRSRSIHGPAYRFNKLVLGRTLQEEALFYCIKCAAYFSQKPINHLQGNGCPSCCEPRHERVIKLWLQTTNYMFEPQKVFPDLRYQNLLRCDFYIEQFNLIIEFDGIQHFEPVEAWGGVEKFRKVQARDRLKDEYCTKKRINLLRMKDGQNVVYEIQKFIEMIRANEKDITLHLIYGKLTTL